MPWRLRQCPHCKTGDLYQQYEIGYSEYQCLQCGYIETEEVPAIDRLKKVRQGHYDKRGIDRRFGCSPVKRTV